MTALPCSECGQWVGTCYEGNNKYGEHKCLPERIEEFNEAKKELDKLNGECNRRRFEIEEKIYKHS